MVIVMVYRISMPWLCTLECVHTMKCTVQYGAIHYTHCTAHHEIKGIDRWKKNAVNNWKGSRWARFWMVRDILTAVVFSQIPYSNYKISFYDFCIFNLFHCRSLTVDDLFFFAWAWGLHQKNCFAHCMRWLLNNGGETSKTQCCLNSTLLNRSGHFYSIPWKNVNRSSHPSF